MKAAVLYREEALPKYTDFPEPAIQHDDEILVTVKAVAIKHLDKGKASGRHYSSEAGTGNGQVIGSDGICLLPDGTRVYAIGVSGMLAEKALISKTHMTPVPGGLDDATAAALPNAVMGAAMALRFKAGIQPGDVVLVNGATGCTGRIAVQLAKYYGAGKVIATGRNAPSLQHLLSLGADETIQIERNDESFKTTLTTIHAATPVDVIIDYLWGHTAETILACLKGKGRFTNRTRYVSVGSMAGDLMQLSAACLRSVDLQLTGSGLGSWSREQLAQLFSDILPEAFNLAAAGKLQLETLTMPLHRIAELWNLEVPAGQRLVVTIG